MLPWCHFLSPTRPYSFSFALESCFLFIFFLCVVFPPLFATMLYQLSALFVLKFVQYIHKVMSPIHMVIRTFAIVCGRRRRSKNNIRRTYPETAGFCQFALFHYFACRILIRLMRSAMHKPPSNKGDIGKYIIQHHKIDWLVRFSYEIHSKPKL